MSMKRANIELNKKYEAQKLGCSHSQFSISIYIKMNFYLFQFMNLNEKKRNNIKQTFSFFD